MLRLGYDLVSIPGADRQDDCKESPAAQLMIVDDRRTATMLHPSTRLPMILLTGAQRHSRSQTDEVDDSTVGFVQRRASLGALYELLQTTLETCPRSVPRVEDALPARATKGQESFIGAIRSISEKGCLLQSSEALTEDQPVEVCFPLADLGLVQIVAQPSYQAGDCTGLVFDEDTPEATRRALSDYVENRLTG
ncbi:MAG: PilZ domain-containing protein [bacterium]|nr:PilZ domain-containing protein [bacterium]MCP5067140.1 PilZ domain-containing protein [bacterium]